MEDAQKRKREVAARGLCTKQPSQLSGGLAPRPISRRGVGLDVLGHPGCSDQGWDTWSAALLGNAGYTSPGWLG